MSPKRSHVLVVLAEQFVHLAFRVLAVLRESPLHHVSQDRQALLLLRRDRDEPAVAQKRPQHLGVICGGVIRGRRVAVRVGHLGAPGVQPWWDGSDVGATGGSVGASGAG